MRARLAGALALTVAGLTVPTLLAAPAGADTTTTLATTTLGELAVDPGHQHLFVTGGKGSNGVEVRSFSGAHVATVANQPGADGMALSPDGSTLYVALVNADSVSAIDTATLTEVGRWSTGASTCPRDVAYAGGLLWVSYSCDQWPSNIAPLDVASPSATLGTAFAPNTYYDGARLTAAGNVLVALERGISGGSPNTRSYDVSTGTPSLLGGAHAGDNCQDAAVSPDGTSVVVACGAPYYHSSFATATMSAGGVYTTSHYPNAVAESTTLVAAGINGFDPDPDVYVFARGGSSPLRTIDVGHHLLGGGLALAPDGSRLFALTRDGSGSPIVLHVVPNPSLVPLTPTLSVTTDHATYGYGAKVTVTARLGATHDSRVVSIYATPVGGSRHLVRSGTVSASGSLAASYTVTRRTTFSVSYAGDERYAARTVSRTVTVKARLAEVLKRASSHSGKYAVYRRSVNPVEIVTVTPRQPGSCVRYRAEAYVHHRWRKVAASSCFALDATSRGAAILRGTHAAGVPYRMRAELHANTVSAATVGAWRYFRFR